MNWRLPQALSAGRIAAPRACSQSPIEVDCGGAAGSISLPWRGRHRRPSAAVLSTKDADAEHRLWPSERSERRRRGGVSLLARKFTPPRLATSSLADPPPPGEGGRSSWQTTL